MLKRVSVNELAVGMFVHGFDGSWLNHPFWRTRFLIEDLSSIAKVRESGIEGCWIDTSKGADVAVRAQTNLATESEPDHAPDLRQSQRTESVAEELSRAAQVRQRSARVMSGVFAQARLGKAVDVGHCGALVHDIVESIDRNPHALLSLVRLKTGDEYTYLHSVAVCTLMVALARELGCDDGVCREVGLAGLMHDLGKAAIPQAILNKPGKLLPEEFEIIKSHPRLGFDMLVRNGGAGEAVQDVCLHHHERMDGKGYLDGLGTEQISAAARMGDICDVYDALS